MPETTNLTEHRKQTLWCRLPDRIRSENLFTGIMAPLIVWAPEPSVSGHGVFDSLRRELDIFPEVRYTVLFDRIVSYPFGDELEDPLGDELTYSEIQSAVLFLIDYSKRELGGKRNRIETTVQKWMQDPAAVCSEYIIRPNYRGSPMVRADRTGNRLVWSLMTERRDSDTFPETMDRYCMPDGSVYVLYGPEAFDLLKENRAEVFGEEPVETV